MTYSKQEITDLIDGRLPWIKTKEIMSHPKDDDRFEKYIEILQERVSWPERILLPISEHLYVVEKNEDRIIKCDCGHEFGDYRINWKLSALIYVRDTEESLEEVYPGIGRPDPGLCEVREFYCPGCAALLKVESLPAGYPIVFDFLPNIDALYEDWLGIPVAGKKEYRDLTHDITRNWANGG